MEDGIYPYTNLSSGRTIQSVNGPENCILDNFGSDFSLKFSSYDLGGVPALRGLTIRGAGAGSSFGVDGGAVFCTISMTIDNCIFEDNLGQKGAALRFNNSTSTISNCLFRNNDASQFGGAIYAVDSNLTITNCTVENNSALIGGGIVIKRGNGTIRNCTIVNNDGGGVDFVQGETPESEFDINHSIVWGNTNGGQVEHRIGTLDVEYCNIEGGAAGVVSLGGGVLNLGPGIIGLDPLFVNAPAGDFHLSVGSPCVDAGDPSFIPAMTEVDIDGEPRLNGLAVDLGSDEL